MSPDTAPALLVVDDNEDNRYTLLQRLKRHGYSNLATATNGREALAMLAAQPFDLVLLDVTMPEMNGYEVLERVKEDPHLRRVPVIMISALDQIDSVVRCIELGAEDYLAKPFNPTLLKARVGATLEKKRLRDEIDAYLARIERELDWARRVQLGMVADRFPAPTLERPVDLFGTLLPARQVGGDLFDFFWRDDHRLCLVIADVSDKGAAAALFMARTKTLVRMVGTLLVDAQGQLASLDTVATRVNAELCRDNGEGMFVTLVLGELDLRTLGLRYCNAGHPPPYVIDAAGRAARLDGGRGKAMGIRPHFPYAAAEHQLAPGDTVFLYTDGITEAEDGHGALFGDARLQEALLQQQQAGVDRAEDRVRTVVQRVRDFAGAAAQADDIAALAARVVGGLHQGALSDMAEIVIASELAEIGRVARLVDELSGRWQLAADVRADLQVVLDEVLTNVVSYAYGEADAGRIHVRLQLYPDAVRAIVEDQGQPFDPFGVAPPDRTLALHERKVGGLGIHFVKRLMSRVSYQRDQTINRTTLDRALHRTHASGGSP